MASSSSDMGDNFDAPTCPVCLKIYKEPVALPCGHSFCHVCIEKYWESREEDCVCPNCHEVFAQKPKLKKNVAFADSVENIVNVKKGGPGGTESRCELCNGEAAKRCVPCEILFCEQHLKPHQQKRHKLMDPEVKIEELRCTQHGKPIQLYCKDDGSLMCVTCTGGQYQDHKVVAVEIAHSERKGVLAAKYPHVSQSMESVASQLQQVQKEKEQTESEINKRKMEKLSLLGKQKEKLEQQMEDLREEKSTMDTAFQMLEAVSFLQGSKDLLKRLETLSDFKSMKRTPLPVLDFSKEEKNLDGLITLNKNFLEKIQRPVEHPEEVELDQNNLRRLYGRTPSLDPNSAHPEIKISGDLRTATLTRTENQYPEHPDRFDYWSQVVSRESFSSGRHYWEVDVRTSRWWGMGICLNSMVRKGEESMLGLNPESWCLYKYNNKYSACHNDQRNDLSVPGDPERFGFFLDCEAGELTCFGDSRVLHVFSGNFMDPVKPALGVWVDSVHFVHLVK